LAWNVLSLTRQTVTALSPEPRRPILHDRRLQLKGWDVSRIKPDLVPSPTVELGLRSIKRGKDRVAFEPQTAH